MGVAQQVEVREELIQERHDCIWLDLHARTVRVTSRVNEKLRKVMLHVYLHEQSL